MVLRHRAARIAFLTALAALVAGCTYNNGYPVNYPLNGAGGPGTNGYPTNPSATSG